VRVNLCCKKVNLYLATLEKTVMSSSSSVQFSYNGVNAGISLILLNIKCPQLSKPKAKNQQNFVIRFDPQDNFHR